MFGCQGNVCTLKINLIYNEKDAMLNPETCCKDNLKLGLGRKSFTI